MLSNRWCIVQDPDPVSSDAESEQDLPETPESDIFMGTSLLKVCPIALSQAHDSLLSIPSVAVPPTVKQKESDNVNETSDVIILVHSLPSNEPPDESRINSVFGNNEQNILEMKIFDVPKASEGYAS